jgi:UDP-glucose 4-epimerase
MNVFGPRRSSGLYSGVMTKFAEALVKRTPMTIYGDGEQTRDFVHVSDVVSAVLLSLKKKKAIGETFNIGSGEPVSINQLAERFIKLWGSNAKGVVHASEREGEVRHSYADLSKAYHLLGYVPRTDLRTGLREFLGWYMSKGVSMPV